MNEESTFGGAPFQDQNNRSNSSQAYLQRAASAVNDGDIILGVHLYLAAYERALHESHIPSEEVIQGMSKAWDLAVSAKQRSLAEYIFEKLEPFWEPEEIVRHAEELQQLAFDKLEEYGFDREVVEDMADMVNQDLLDSANEVLCHFEESAASVEKRTDSQQVESSNSDESARDVPQDVSSEGTDQDGQATKVNAVPIAPDSPLAAAFAQLGAMATSASQDAAEVEAQRFDYRNLVGFDEEIEFMGTLGIGRSNDPEFARFLEMLNTRHGLPGMPALGTLVFKSPAREDANCFMVATVGELGMPAIRMRLDRNAMGQVVLCVMASPDFKSRLSGLSRGGLETPTVVVIEDLDLWDLPLFDVSGDDAQSLASMQLSRGAREALALVQMALSSPEATVLISASEPEDIDPFFQDLIGPHRIIDIDLPDAKERRAIWRSEQAQHPSMRGLDVNQLVDFSRTLSRFEIYAISSEAVEEAYRESVAQGTFCAVPTDDILMRLSNFQPLESDEYQRMEDLAVESLRKSFSDFDDLLKG